MKGNIGYAVQLFNTNSCLHTSAVESVAHAGHNSLALVRLFFFFLRDIGD